MGTCEMTEELYPCRECFGGTARLPHFTSLSNLQFWLCSDCSMLVAVATGIWLWRSVRVCTWALALLASACASVTLAAASCWLWLSRMLFNSVWDFAQSRMVLSSGARFSRLKIVVSQCLFGLACLFPVSSLCLPLSGGFVSFKLGWHPGLQCRTSAAFVGFLQVYTTCNKSEGFRRLKVGFSAVSCHSNARPQVSYNSSPDLMDPAAGLSCVTLGKTD